MAPGGSGNGGRVEAIFLSPRARELPVAVTRVRAACGRGLEGDRYHDGTGSFSWKGRGNGRDLTLIAAEALEALAAEHGIELTGAASRRNLLTRGIALDALLGRRFLIGNATCVGVRPCEPCTHLARLTHPGVLSGLAGRGGLRADLVAGGSIAVGDAIVVQPG
ncbi:MAG: MOSC domain-containing protein [Solirubrobacteraceae bacterium]|jgi:MOSC domain-containing protein YiiM